MDSQKLIDTLLDLKENRRLSSESEAMMKPFVGEKDSLPFIFLNRVVHFRVDWTKNIQRVNRFWQNWQKVNLNVQFCFRHLKMSGLKDFPKRMHLFQMLRCWLWIIYIKE